MNPLKTVGIQAIILLGCPSFLVGVNASNFRAILLLGYPMVGFPNKNKAILLLGYPMVPMVGSPIKNKAILLLGYPILSFSVLAHRF